MNVPPHDAVALDEMAAVLLQPRELFLQVSKAHHPWKPAADSQAARDLAKTIFPEEVNSYLLHYPRSVASMYVRFSADYLAGIAALFQAREVMVAPIGLARSAYEHAIRAVVILDLG